MDYEIISRKDQDLGRGFGLLGAAAVMMLLTWVVPAVAPVALAGYGIYLLFMRSFRAMAVALLGAVGLWFLAGLLGGLLWWFGAAMAGFGLFFLIRGFRGRYLTE
ncbi:MAG: hypothetical protein IIA14_13560 [SAR324 cluster bacterium]|nr:hypothetical protein [SAR324 cluster bacterium]